MKRKQLPPQVLFATPNHDDQLKLKPVHYSFKHETVLPSLKMITIRVWLISEKINSALVMIMKEKKNVNRTLDSFSFDAVHPIQVSIKKPITKNAKTLFKHFFLILRMKIRLGVENRKTKCQTKLICL